MHIFSLLKPPPTDCNTTRTITTCKVFIQLPVGQAIPPFLVIKDDKLAIVPLYIHLALIFRQSITKEALHLSTKPSATFDLPNPGIELYTQKDVAV